MAYVSKATKLARKLLKSKAIGGAPHLTEFVECLVREFGGPDAAAKEMRVQYDDAPKSYKLAFWRMLMKQVEVNTVMGGADDNFTEMSSEELEAEIKRVVLTRQPGEEYAVE